MRTCHGWRLSLPAPTKTSDCDGKTQRKKKQPTFTLLEYRTRRSTLKSSASLPSKRENWFSIKADTATRPASRTSLSYCLLAPCNPEKRSMRTLSGVNCANNTLKSLSKPLSLSQISQCKVDFERDVSNGVGLDGPIKGLVGGESTTGFCRDKAATL